jgi:integrase
MTAEGKRRRKFFRTETEAKKAAAKAREAYRKGMRGAVMSQDMAMDALAAARILEGSGISLVEAARLAMAKQADPRGAETFEARYDRVMAVGEIGWSDAYAVKMARVPRWIGKEGMAARCASMSEVRIEELVRGAAAGKLADSTVTMRVARVLAVLGERALKRQGRGRRRGPASLMSAEEMEKMIAAASGPEERRVVGLALFAGIRPDAEHGEISRLDWADVKADHVFVAAEVSKTRTDRIVPMSPALARMIEGHPAEGPVRPAGWRRSWQRIRKAAGVGGKPDCTRHAFASHFLAWKGELATKAAMGHTAGSSTLFRHYARAVSAENGKRFFEKGGT